MKVVIHIVKIILLSLTMISCDPEFEYIFSGKIVSSENKKGLDNVKIDFELYPLENFHHWRSLNIDSTSNVITNKKGEFEISFSTLSINYDILIIKFDKEGYNDKIIISESNDWNSKVGLNYRKIYFTFEKIMLEETP